MKWICALVMLLCCACVEAFLSILTDGKNKSLPSLETKNLGSYEVNLLRIMINQETTIRLALVKHVHELISDVSLIKQSLTASETRIEGLKHTIVSLQREYMELKHSSNAKISKLETKLQTVNENISSVQERKTSIAGLQQTVEALTIQVNSLQEENGEIKNRSIKNHARMMELETKLQTVKEDVRSTLQKQDNYYPLLLGLRQATESLYTKVNSLQLERSEFKNGTINNYAMIMELKTRLQTVNESVSSLHEQVDIIQRESDGDMFNRTNGVLEDIKVEVRNLSRTLSDFRKHRETEDEDEDHFAGIYTFKHFFTRNFISKGKLNTFA